MPDITGKIQFDAELNLSHVEKAFAKLDSEYKTLQQRAKQTAQDLANATTPDQRNRLSSELIVINREMRQLDSASKNLGLGRSLKTLSTSTKSLNTSIAQANTSMKNFSSTLSENAINSAAGSTGMLGNALQTIGPAGLVAAGGIGAVVSGAKAFIQAVSEGLDYLKQFEYGIGQIATLMDEEAENEYLPGFSVDLKKIAVESGQTFNVLETALYNILSAGIRAADSISVLEIATQGAIAGATDTSTAVNGLTTIMNTFGISAMQASDIFFNTIKLGKTTYEELANSVGQVAATAANAGASFEEVGAALAVMTAGGVKTDQAITSLNAIFSRLNTSEGIEAFKQIGIDVQDANGELRNLAEIVSEVNRAGLNQIQIGEIVASEEAKKGFNVLIQDATNSAGEIVSAMESQFETFDPSTLTGATIDAFNDMADQTIIAEERIARQREVSLMEMASAFKPIEAEWNKTKMAFWEGVGNLFETTDSLVARSEDLRDEISNLEKSSLEFQDAIIQASNSGEDFNEIITQATEISPNLGKQLQALVDDEGLLIGSTEDMIAVIRDYYDLASTQLSFANLTVIGDLAEDLEDYSNNVSHFGRQQEAEIQRDIDAYTNMSEIIDEVSQKYGLQTPIIGRQYDLIVGMAHMQEQLNNLADISTNEEKRAELYSEILEYQEEYLAISGDLGELQINFNESLESQAVIMTALNDANVTAADQERIRTQFLADQTAQLERQQELAKGEGLFAGISFDNDNLVQEQELLAKLDLQTYALAQTEEQKIEFQREAISLRQQELAAQIRNRLELQQTANDLKTGFNNIATELFGVEEIFSDTTSDLEEQRNITQNLVDEYNTYAQLMGETEISIENITELERQRTENIDRNQGRLASERRILEIQRDLGIEMAATDQQRLAIQQQSIRIRIQELRAIQSEYLNSSREQARILLDLADRTTLLPTVRSSFITQAQEIMRNGAREALALTTQIDDLEEQLNNLHVPETFSTLPTTISRVGESATDSTAAVTDYQNKLTGLIKTLYDLDRQAELDLITDDNMRAIEEENRRYEEQLELLRNISIEFSAVPNDRLFNLMSERYSEDVVSWFRSEMGDSSDINTVINTITGELERVHQIRLNQINETDTAERSSYDKRLEQLTQEIAIQQELNALGETATEWDRQRITLQHELRNAVTDSGEALYTETQIRNIISAEQELFDLQIETSNKYTDMLDDINQSREEIGRNEQELYSIELSRLVAIGEINEEQKRSLIAAHNLLLEEELLQDASEQRSNILQEIAETIKNYGQDLTQSESISAQLLQEYNDAKSNLINLINDEHSTTEQVLEAQTQLADLETRRLAVQQELNTQKSEEQRISVNVHRSQGATLEEQLRIAELNRDIREAITSDETSAIQSQLDALNREIELRDYQNQLIQEGKYSVEEISRRVAIQGQIIDANNESFEQTTEITEGISENVDDLAEALYRAGQMAVQFSNGFTINSREDLENAREQIEILQENIHILNNLRNQTTDLEVKDQINQIVIATGNAIHEIQSDIENFDLSFDWRDWAKESGKNLYNTLTETLGTGLGEILSSAIAGSISDENFVDLFKNLGNSISNSISGSISTALTTSIGEVMGGTAGEMLGQAAGAIAGPIAGALIGSIFTLISNKINEDSSQKYINMMEKKLNELERSIKKINSYYEAGDQYLEDSNGKIEDQIELHEKTYGIKKSEKELEISLYDNRLRLAALEEEMTRYREQGLELKTLETEIQVTGIEDIISQEEILLNLKKEQHTAELDLIDDLLEKIRLEADLLGETTQTLERSVETSFDVVVDLINAGADQGAIDQAMSDFLGYSRQAIEEGLFTQNEINTLFVDQILAAGETVNKQLTAKRVEKGKINLKLSIAQIYETFMESGRPDLATKLYEKYPDILDEYMGLVSSYRNEGYNVTTSKEQVLNLYRTEIEQISDEIRELGGEIIDFSFLQEGINSLKDEQLKADLSVLETEIGLLKQKQQLEEKNLENKIISDNVTDDDASLLRKELEIQQANELLALLNTELNNIDTLMAIYNDPKNTALASEINDLESKRFDILNEISTLQNNILETEQNQTAELTEQNDLTGEMNDEMRALLIKRQQLELQAVEGGGYTPVLLQSIAAMNQQILGLGEDLNIDVSQFGISTTEIPSYDSGGYIPQDTLAYLHAGEYVVSDAEAAFKRGQNSFITNGETHTDTNVVLNQTFAVNGATVKELTENVRNIVKNESLDIIRSGFKKIGMPISTLQ